jgi:nucleotide-binding universal stress UspA family protein
MVYHFQNILVPVDFTINTDAAIDNAIAMCNVNNTKVHLFHVKVDYWTVAPYHINGSFAMPGDNIIEKGISIEEGLFKLKKSIQVRYPLLDILTHVGSSGKVQEAIISKAKQVKADLIVISKNNSHQWFGFFNLINSSVIARETKSAVLNVVPGTRLSKIKNIVMPLRSFIPGRKLELLRTKRQ